MAAMQRELTMGYDDPRLGGLLQQPISSGGNAGIDWESMFPSLQSSIDSSRASYNQQRDRIAANDSMSNLWPDYANPDQYDASGFPKQLIDSGATTLQSLVDQFNQKVSGNRLRVLPNGQVSFIQDIQGDSDWTNKLGDAFGFAAGFGIPVGMAAAAGAGAASAAGAGVGAAEGAGLPSVWGSSLPYGSAELGIAGTGGSLAGSVDAPWGVNPQGTGNMADFMQNYNPDNFFQTPGINAGNLTSPVGDFTASQLPGGALSQYGGLSGMVDLGGAGGVLGAGAAGGGMSSLLETLTQKIGEQAAKTVLGKVMNGTATSDDWTKLLGTLGSTALGIYGSNQQANSLTDISNQSRADREPFLNAATGWLNDPASYYASAPAQEAMKGVLHGLSVNGNPANNPTAMASASEAALRNWQNAVTGFGNIGLAGQDSRNQLLSNAATADRGITASLASGLGTLTNPQDDLSTMLARLKAAGLA